MTGVEGATSGITRFPINTGGLGASTGLAGFSMKRSGSSSDVSGSNEEHEDPQGCGTVVHTVSVKCP